LAEIMVSGIFDDPRARSIRFLQEAARLGPVHLLLWSDLAAEALTGRVPKFPAAERQYFLESVRYVERVTLLESPAEIDALPLSGLNAPAGPGPSTGSPKSGGEAHCESQQDRRMQAWVMQTGEGTPARQAWCAGRGIEYRVIPPAEIAGFPEPVIPEEPSRQRKKVIVTGCYDWLHSGHVRFFEEAATYGELYVALGSDANVRNLKGEGHPLLSQAERRYMVGSIRFVHQALVNTGWGMMDAEPEIARLRPDIYLVNEDGDTPEKREFCAAHGLDYVVLKRLPKEGLRRRSSTNLRGF
jgi:cytidyltransferase-like protein